MLFGNRHRPRILIHCAGASSVLPNGLDGGKLWGVGCRIFDKGLAHVASIAVAPDNLGTAAIAVWPGAEGGDIPTPL